MATGDQADILARIKATLPSSWFATDAPILDGLLSGFANVASWIYGLIAYAKLQTRISTATDGWLDLIADDFFGRRFLRGNRSDTLFRQAILAELFRPRQTRQAIIDVLVGLTGRTPQIFEPARPHDTGGYSPGPSGDRVARGLAYNTVGGYGSLLMPYELLVHAYRSGTAGIPSVAGYVGLLGASSGLPVMPGYSTVSGAGVSTISTVIPGRGGYSTASAIEYGSLDMIEGSVKDSDIYSAVDNVRAAGITAWTAISN